MSKRLVNVMTGGSACIGLWLWVMWDGGSYSVWHAGLVGYGGFCCLFGMTAISVSLAHPFDEESCTTILVLSSLLILLGIRIFFGAFVS